MFPWEDMRDILSFSTPLWCVFLNIAQTDLAISLQTSLSVHDNTINVKLDIKTWSCSEISIFTIPCCSFEIIIFKK